MQLSPLDPVSLRDLADAHEASVNRSPGLHVTQIIYEGIMPAVDPKKFGPAAKAAYPEHTVENWQEAGFLWEELLSAIFAARGASRPVTTATAATTAKTAMVRFRPGELVEDGIVLSPDALVYGVADLSDVPEVIVEEYKCTWKSSKGFDLYDKRYLGWLLQIRAYCYAVGTTEARLYVLHINGGYEGYIPEVRPWRLQFSRAELQDTWQQIVNTARSKGWL